MEKYDSENIQIVLGAPRHSSLGLFNAHLEGKTLLEIFSTQTMAELEELGFFKDDEGFSKE
jgi:hypothetical protein